MKQKAPQNKLDMKIRDQGTKIDWSKTRTEKMRNLGLDRPGGLWISDEKLTYVSENSVDEVQQQGQLESLTVIVICFGLISSLSFDSLVDRTLLF